MKVFNTRDRIGPLQNSQQSNRKDLLEKKNHLHKQENSIQDGKGHDILRTIAPLLVIPIKNIMLIGGE